MVSLGDIKAARERIRGAIRQTPVLYSEILSREAGNQLFLKLENLNITGSYKERGALNKILTLTADERARGVITASAGNHAQAVAYHASQRGIRAQICMPEYTPLVKVTATRAWGAEVILFGANYDEALEEAKRRCRVENLVFLHAFDDPAVIAGQGTIGLELLEQIPDMDAVVVPVGGGGLIAGVACAVKETRPEARIVGIQPQALPAMEAALLLRKPVMLPAAATIADGIAVRQLVS
jgi:threonine dehydratase